jgi:(p)ppGpp synthase/HD superfamily hydrolase
MTDLKTNQLLASALQTAAVAHKGGLRKGKEVPYIVHPVEVALTLQEYGKSEEVIAAGLLHDTLEDTDVTKEDLEAEFGREITDLVIGASEKLTGRDDKPWEERKEHTVQYLKTAPRKIKYISCADKLSNIRSMIREYEEVGADLWDKFTRGYQKQKWYYNSLVESLQELEGEEMYRQLKLAVRHLFKKKTYFV